MLAGAQRGVFARIRADFLDLEMRLAGCDPALPLSIEGGALLAAEGVDALGFRGEEVLVVGQGQHPVWHVATGVHSQPAMRPKRGLCQVAGGLGRPERMAAAGLAEGCRQRQALVQEALWWGGCAQLCSAIRQLAV